MAEQHVLNTRIQLKYDSYANWSTSNLVLLAGELGICTIPEGSTEATTNPTVLFKVGDGTTPAKNLKWASALAADVYNWAKSETVALESEEIKDGDKVTGYKQYLRFKTGETVNHEVDLSSFATDEEVNTIKETFESRLSTIEANLGLGDGTEENSVTAQLADHEGRISDVEGTLETITSADDTKEGSIKNAIKVVKEYAVSQDTAQSTTLKKYVDDTVAAQAETQSSVDAAQDKLIGDNTKAITDEATARADADNLINAKFGTDYSATNTVASAIADAKLAGTNAAQAVADLTKKDDEGKAVGPVAVNTEQIAAVAADLSEEATTRKGADDALDERLGKVEAFFKAADHDGEAGGLNDALDTLKEIQDYLSGDGTASGDLLSKIDNHENRITTVEDEINGKGDTIGIKARLTQADADITAVEGRADALEDKVTTLETLTGAGGTIQTNIASALEKAQQGIDDAADAKGAADNAQDDVDALAKIVNGEGEDKGLAGDIETNASDISKLNAKVDLAETETVKGVIASTLDTLNFSSPEASSDEAVSFIDTISQVDGKISATKKNIPNASANKAGIVKLGATGGAATFDEVNTMSGEVAAHNTRLNDLESDYVRVADNKMYLGKTGTDYIIFNCGGATE